MQYDKEFGLAYDCLLYGIIYFNDEGMSLEIITDKKGFQIDPFSYYQDIFNHSVIPSERLRPLFEREFFSSAIANYFLHRMSFHNSISDFIFDITFSSNDFKKFLIEFMLQGENKGTITEVLKSTHSGGVLSLLKKLKVNTSSSKKLVYILNNFETIINDLLGFFNTVLPIITALHQSHEDEITTCLFEFEELSHNEQFTSILSIEGCTFEDIHITVCLLCKFMLNISINNNSLNLLSGTVGLHKQLLVIKYGNINRQRFLFLTNNDSGHKFYQALQCAEMPLSIAEISKASRLTLVTIQQLIRVFESEHIVSHCVEPNNTLRFFLNKECLRYIYPRIQEHVDNLFKNLLDFNF